MFRKRLEVHVVTKAFVAMQLIDNAYKLVTGVSTLWFTSHHSQCHFLLVFEEVVLHSIAVDWIDLFALAFRLFSMKELYIIFFVLWFC